MSRLKKFARSLLSGYVLLGTNIFYTLASVPLALHYLSKEEFGLWALVSQLGGYIQLIDFGMSSSVARILIDHKDDRHNGAYGSVIKSGALVGLIQGILIMGAGAVLSLLAGSLVGVPGQLRHEFIWLMTGQAIILGGSFATRIFSNLLMAHQRLDISNYGAAAFFVINLVVMWVGFASGLGIYSLLGGVLVMTLGSAVVNIVGCISLRCFPNRHEWGTINRARFRELFAFGSDIFIFSLGGQLINASQTILLTRLFGLETAAVWNVCTRTYTVLTQIIFRMFDYSAPAFAEMMVRGEKALLAQRFKQIVILSLNLAAAAGAVFTLCNGPFIRLWTHGRIGWAPVNDLLLAVWLVICVAMHAHTGLVGQTKRLHFMRYLFFIEGMAFVGLTIAFHSFGGITAMLIASIGCTCCFSLPYGFYRTHKYFGLSWPELARWHKPVILLVLWLAPVGALIWWLIHGVSPVVRLVVGGGGFALWTIGAFLSLGLNPHLKAEMAGRAPRWARSVLDRTILHVKNQPDS